MADEKKNIDAETGAPPAYAPNPAPYPQATYPQPTYPPPNYSQPGYSQPGSGLNSTGVTVNNGVMYTTAQPLANPPPDHMAWSIISTVFCCFWLGIAAIIKSRESRAAALMGQHEQAKEASEKAKLYNILSDVFGFIFLGAYAGFLYWYLTRTRNPYLY